MSQSSRSVFSRGPSAVGWKSRRNVDHCLDSAAFRVNNEGSVIVLAVVRARPRCAIVSSTMSQRSRMELVDSATGVGTESEMKSWARSMRTVIDEVEQQFVALSGESISY